MIAWLRYPGAVVAGFFVTGLLAAGVELLGMIIHPFPEDFGGTPEEVVRHVEVYPAWGLAVAVVLWGVAAFAGAWTAGRLGGRWCVLLLGLLLLAAVILNISMLPYPVWFMVASVLLVLAATALGHRYSSRPATLVASTGE